MNPAVERAIQLQLQKCPPFTDDDLASVGALGVLRPTDIAGIERLTGLEGLVLVGYGGRDLDSLAGLGLVTLEVEVSAVDSVQIVTRLPRLRTLTVKNCAVEEIDVLAEGDHSVDELNLTGNPLSERAYHEVLPQLRERIPALVVSDEREWRLTRRLYAAGLPFDYYRDAQGYWLCRPGLAYTGFPNADHLGIDPEDLEAILDRDPSEIPGLFPTYDD